MNPQNHEQHIQHTFDSYCKEILKYAMFDYYRAINMYFFFGMKDREIAEHLNMVRRTVAYQRTGTLRKLKNLLEHMDIER